MPCASVIHFGRDDCHRVQTLRHVGYEVREAESLHRLRLDLDRADVDAIIVAEADPRCAERAAALVRKRSGAPLILFRPPDVALDESRFDRVYAQPVPPSHWLFDTAVLVMQAKELRADSERLLRQSQAA